MNIKSQRIENISIENNSTKNLLKKKTKRKNKYTIKTSNSTSLSSEKCPKSIKYRKNLFTFHEDFLQMQSKVVDIWIENFKNNIEIFKNKHLENLESQKDSYMKIDENDDSQISGKEDEEFIDFKNEIFSEFIIFDNFFIDIKEKIKNIISNVRNNFDAANNFKNINEFKFYMKNIQKSYFQTENIKNLIKYNKSYLSTKINEVNEKKINIVKEDFYNFIKKNSNILREISDKEEIEEITEIKSEISDKDFTSEKENLLTIDDIPEFCNNLSNLDCNSVLHSHCESEDLNSLDCKENVSEKNNYEESQSEILENNLSCEKKGLKNFTKNEANNKKFKNDCEPYNKYFQFQTALIDDNEEDLNQDYGYTKLDKNFTLINDKFPISDEYSDTKIIDINSINNDVELRDTIKYKSKNKTLNNFENEIKTIDCNSDIDIKEEHNSGFFNLDNFTNIKENSGKKHIFFRIIKFKKGNIKYIGEICENRFHGTGILFYPNGNVQYIGYFIKNKYNGNGFYYDEMGNLYYIGEHSEDYSEGLGINLYPEFILRSMGNFVKDKLKGKGISFDINELILEGNFENDEMEKFGTSYDKKGKIIYEGLFHRNMYNCIGILTNSDKKEIYFGEFKNWLAHGIGILIGKEKKIIYKGEFSKGVINGFGKLYNNKGMLKYEGNFKNMIFNGLGALYNVQNGNLRNLGEYENGRRNRNKENSKIIINKKININNFFLDKFKFSWNEKREKLKNQLDKIEKKKISLFDTMKKEFYI